MKNQSNFKLCSKLPGFEKKANFNAKSVYSSRMKNWTRSSRHLAQRAVHDPLVLKLKTFRQHNFAVRQFSEEGGRQDCYVYCRPKGRRRISPGHDFCGTLDSFHSH